MEDSDGIGAKILNHHHEKSKLSKLWTRKFFCVGLHWNHVLDIDDESHEDHFWASSVLVGLLAGDNPGEPPTILESNFLTNSD